MADGFLGRWARRKEAVRKGVEVPAEPELAAPLSPRVPPPQPSPGGGGGEAGTLPLPPGEGGGEGTTASPPPPTLEDTHALTPDSDFTRFVRPDVAPEVRNAALKKLFADPHFNVMDGLDTYIDDYNKPDPLPPEMLRQLASAKFLKLFDDEEAQEATPAPAPGEVPTERPPQSVAQSPQEDGPAVPPTQDHADPDLRLQQDDAPGPDGPGTRPG